MIDWVKTAGTRLLSRLYTDQTGRVTQARLAAAASQPWAPADQYALLERYYAGSGLYAGALPVAAASIQPAPAAPAMRSLRTPAFQVVEFYVATVWPGRLDDALTIELVDPATKNTALEPAIKQVWTWSNWEAKRQVHVRKTTMLGDGFVKVVVNDRRDRVFFELLDPAHVTEIDADERGYLTYARIDVPNPGRAPNVRWGKIHTETWSKDEQVWRSWLHEQPGRPIAELGPPDQERTFRDMFGGDFVPIVHTKFRDVGDDRGAGAYLHQLEKIDEQNLKATTMSRQIFRHGSTWVLERQGLDKDGRPLPPVTIAADPATGLLQIRVGDEPMYVLPGNTTLKSIVPDLDYAAMLAIEQADGVELQRDLVEKAYWQIMERGGDLSGKALRTLLLPAIARAEEARGTFEQGLVRLDQMACTMAAFYRLDGFTGLGTFEDGSLNHRFAERPVIPIGEDEEMETLVKSWAAAKMERDAGVGLRQVLLERDYPSEDIDRILTEREADQSALNDALGTILDRQPGSAAPVVPAGGRPANGPVPPNANGGSSG